jgi:class 3 adenylate cyclase
VARLQRARFSETTDVRRFPHGRVEVVELDDRAIGRMVYEPGWRWSVDVKPIAGTDSCQFHHLGVTISGRLRVQMPDGTELEVGPGDVFEFPPGHDAWVVGDDPWVSIDFEAVRRYGRSTAALSERTLATILITDIVDSTRHAVDAGAAQWRETVAAHNRTAERIIDGHRGRLVKTTGDGVIALFDSAERAVRSGAEIEQAVEPLGLSVRAGVHSGEVELAPSDVRGVAVHAASRIAALAGPGEVLVSATVRDLMDGSDLEFEDAGLHELKGLPGARQLYRLARPGR